jgi:hypothetical protein
VRYLRLHYVRYWTVETTLKVSNHRPEKVENTAQLDRASDALQRHCILADVESWLPMVFVQLHLRAQAEWPIVVRGTKMASQSTGPPNQHLRICEEVHPRAVSECLVLPVHIDRLDGFHTSSIAWLVYALAPNASAT